MWLAKVENEFRAVRSFGRAAAKAVALAAGLLACVPTVRAADSTFVGVLAVAVEADAIKALGLSKDQVNDLLDLIEAREQKAVSLAMDKELPAAEREIKLAAFRAESESQGLKILTPEQRLKVEQLRVKKAGMLTLSEPKIAEQLKLTAEQAVAVKSMLAARDGELSKASGRGIDQVKANFERKLMEVLDAPQRAQWDQLAGGAPVNVDGAVALKQPETAKPVVAPAPAQAAPALAPKVEGAKPAPVAGGQGKSPDGRIRFSFRFAPWADVLDWFAQQADLSLIMDSPPQGTFNYTDTRSYSPAEAIDLLNYVLQTKGFTLICRDRMLVLYNLEDGPPNPTMVPNIRLEDLDKKGEFELVRVLFKVEKISPAEAQAEVLPLVGLQGSVVVMPKAGYIMVQETAGRLRMIRSVLDSIEKPTSDTGGSLRVFSLEHALLSDVMTTIRPLLDIPVDAFVSVDGSVRIALDPNTGKLLVLGKPDKIASVEAIIKVVDQSVSSTDGGPAVAIETPQIEVYPIINADSASVLAVLQTILANNPDVRLQVDPKTGHLIAMAKPSQHATIKATIAQMQQDGSVLEVIRLRTLDPQTATVAVNNLYTGKTNAPKVTADLSNRQLLVNGTESQVLEIRGFLQKMGETAVQADQTVPGGTESNVRVLAYGGRQMRTALEQAQAIWEATNPKTKIRVVAPSAVIPTMRPSDKSGLPQGIQEGLRGLTAPAPAEEPAPAAVPAAPPAKSDTTRRVDPPGFERTARNSGRWAVPAKFVKLLVQQPAEGAPAADGNAPAAAAADQESRSIVVAPGSAGTMIASEDIAALNQFEQLLTAILQKNSGPQFTIFYLANANVNTVAATLGSIMGSGGSSSSTGSSGGSLLGDIAGAALGGGGGLMGALMGLGGSGGASSAPTIVSTGSMQIIPEPRLNALLVNANPKDLDTIEQLLQILDQAEVPESAVNPKPRMIPVYNTSAASIAEIVKEIYQEQMVGANKSGRQPSPEDFINALRGGGSRGGSSGNQAQPKMAISVSEQNNSLIVSATGTMFEEVKHLVETLDQASSTPASTIKVVTLKRSNASTLQKALTAIAGDKVNTTKVADSGGSSRGSSGSSGGQDQEQADRARRMMEFFNSRGSSSGGSPFGGGGSPFGGGSSPFGGFSRGGDSSRGGPSFGSGSFGGDRGRSDSGRGDSGRGDSRGGDSRGGSDRRN